MELSDIVKESYQKIEQKRIERTKESDETKEDDSSSGSSYPVTEYSGNESSNDDNDYREYHDDLDPIP